MDAVGFTVQTAQPFRTSGNNQLALQTGAERCLASKLLYCRNKSEVLEIWVVGWFRVDIETVTTCAHAQVMASFLVLHCDALDI